MGRGWRRRDGHGKGRVEMGVEMGRGARVETGRDCKGGVEMGGDGKGVGIGKG